jgi:CMP-N,N'-diacetyllegionaminic acid synthase
MRILALIPARGGSKRLPGKNSRLLGGKPLINWSIEAILGISAVCDILVSTDDSEIAEIAKQAGASVPWLRPTNLSTDTASTVDVALHTLDWYETNFEKVDGLLLLQPTSPFRNRKLIELGIGLFSAPDFLPVVGVTPVKDQTTWVIAKDEEYIEPFFYEDRLNTAKPNLLPTHLINGSFYLISPTDLRKNRSFILSKSLPLIVKSPIESLDIDTDLDFKIAESIAREKIIYFKSNATLL